MTLPRRQHVEVLRIACQRPGDLRGVQALIDTVLRVA